MSNYDLEYEQNSFKGNNRPIGGSFLNYDIIK